jgi:hypothetical protein
MEFPLFVFDRQVRLDEVALPAQTSSFNPT